MISAILGVIAAVISGITRMAGSIGIYLAGKTSANLKHEKSARKAAEKDAKRWKNRPRTKSDLLKRMRKYRSSSRK